MDLKLNKNLAILAIAKKLNNTQASIEWKYRLLDALRF